MKILDAFILYIIGYCIIVANDPLEFGESQGPGWGILGFIIMGLAVSLFLS